MAQITLINSFTVPQGREDDFFRMWKTVNAHMRRQPGYLRHSLHKSISPDARYRFVNVAVWESKEYFDAAHDEKFRSLVADPAWRDFISEPVLFEVVHAGEVTETQTALQAS